MKRRAFLGFVCGVMTQSIAASAQQSTSKKRLVVFSPSEASVTWRDYSEGNRALIAELRRLWTVWQPQMNDYVTRALDPTSAPSYGVPGDV